MASGNVVVLIGHVVLFLFDYQTRKMSRKWLDYQYEYYVIT